MLDHDVLLSSLHHIGMSNNTVEWFCTYLSDRLQHVWYVGELSDALPISHGVPEGSVLGPLLYIIHVNDLLHQLLDGCAIACANITLLTSGSSAQSAANSVQQLVKHLSYCMLATLCALTIQNVSLCLFARCGAGRMPTQQSWSVGILSALSPSSLSWM